MWPIFQILLQIVAYLPTILLLKVLFCKSNIDIPYTNIILYNTFLILCNMLSSNKLTMLVLEALADENKPHKSYNISDIV